MAVLIGVVVAVAATAAADGGGSAPSTASSVPTTTLVTVPPTNPASRLVPLTIAPPSHADTYHRDVDFGGFEDVEGCENTRAVVLTRTSRAPVTYTTARDCTVKTGLWTDPDHLVAIISSENESKGDDGPDGWKPPNRAAWCRYALAWDHIESKWHLSATRAEWNALLVMAATCTRGS